MKNWENAEPLMWFLTCETFLVLKSVTIHSNVDKASFLVKHYENFGNESSSLSTCSLLSLKKVNVAITIDSESFQQKCEMLEKKAEKCHASQNSTISFYSNLFNGKTST
jgi:hypothetical protein